MLLRCVSTVIGLVFIFFAGKSLLEKERKVKIDQKSDRKKIFKWFTIGVIVNATNFDAVFLNLTASKEVGIAQNLSIFSKYFLLLVNLFFFTFPVIFPVSLKLLFPSASEKILDKIYVYLKKYCRYIVAILFSILGIVFLRKGILFFW